MAPPSKRPPQGRKPSQGKRPPQGNRPPQARKPAGGPANPAAAGGPTAPAAPGGPTEGPAAPKTARPKAPPAPGAQSGTVADERKAKRESARQERIAIARRKQRAKRQRQTLIAGLLAVALLGAVVYTFNKSKNESRLAAAAAGQAGCGQVQQFKDQGTSHLKPGETFDYNSNPPTSGTHAPQPAIWGSYNQETPAPTLIHNMEHGGIIVNYKGQSNSTVDSIDSFVEQYTDGVISNPNPKIDKPVVIASWGRTQQCERFSVDAVAAYIKKYCAKGPEKVVTCRS